MADASALWRQLLQVQEPWTVREARADEFNRCMDVWIGVEAPRSWFGFGRGKPVESGPEVVWRHTGFGGWKIRVHVRPPLGGEMPRQAWAGEAGMPFTRALDRQVLALLHEGVSMAAVCAFLDLPMAELWRYRYALENGQLGSGGQEASAPAMAGVEPLRNVPRTEAPVAGGVAGSRVPSADDPVWLDLLEGRRQLDVRVLSLQLLLSRTRAQVAVIADADVRRMKLRDVHRYFVKNERMLTYELGQLVREAA
ncbi:MAG TPA: hypothetical protein PKC56_02835 [Rhodocyclaceae bacterium]|nr:hypothetical protein [Rhodocyclaceae bacterium]